MSAISPAATRDGRIRWWDSPVAFVGGNALGILLSIIAGTIAIVVATLHGYRPTQENLLEILNTSFWVNHAALVIGDLGLGAVTWFVAWRRIAKPLAHFFPPIDVRNLVIAIAIGIALAGILNGANLWLQRQGLVTFKDLPMERALIPDGAVQLVATLLVVALFAPFVEELFFRGLFLAWAERVIGPWWAAAATALAFTLAHGHLLLHPGAQGWIYTGELFIAGLALAGLALRTGSLRASLATHAAYNACAIVISVLFP